MKTHDAYNRYERVLEEFLKSINLIIGFDQLLESFITKTKEMLNVKSVYIILYEPITNRYIGRLAKGEQTAQLTEFNFVHTDNLIKWLTVNRCALDVESNLEVLKFLGIPERELIKRSETVMIVPLIVVNRLTGVMFLGNKTDGSRYDQADIDFLSTLANYGALAVEYALIYELQEDKLKKLFHADQLTTVGELAAGAAHEIRNPLTSIRSTIQYLQRDLSNEKKTLVESIIEEVDRIDQIIKGLLSFSKSHELQMTKVNLEDIHNQSLSLLDAELRKHQITVKKECRLGSPIITGDASQLKQVFLNIFINSIQAMPNGGEISIAITDGSKVKKHGIIIVSVRDTGRGIAANDLPKVFQPFFTTKESGTGLGLSISYGIVSKHGGTIEVESSTSLNDHSTTVSVQLPINQAYTAARYE
jgi:signal transduction histidine kinase